MRKFISVLPLFIFISTTSIIAQQTILSANKKELLASIAFHEKNLIQLSDSIWVFAETAFKEHSSSKLLADYAEANGFTVQRGVAEMPTAFVATFGSGKPIIAVMGEFDALPGLSQKTKTTKEALNEGAPGHGCGHNMFGPGSLGAALAIKDLLAKGKIKGTVRFYGTPAEEDGGGKIYMIRAGLFNDVDVCFDWHPGYEIAASMQSSQAIIDLLVEFKGKSAHAAADPWNGRSATDAAELFSTGINYLREHVKPSVRMHYVKKDAGDVPNVVPAKAAVWIWIRDSKRSGVSAVEERVRNIAKGAALMAGVEYNIKIQTGDYEILVNETGAGALQKNLELLGPITYTKDEVDFANQIQKNYGLEASGIDGTIKPLEKTKPDPDGGSSDVGDVSWIVPEISLNVTTAPYKSPWHSWVVVACGGMSIGHKGMIFSSKALAFTMLDLFENETLRTEIRKEFETKKGNEIYKPMIPDGPPKIK